MNCEHRWGTTCVDRIVPDGWRVEWAFPLGFDPYPSLVPLSDTPHEEGEQP